MMGFVASFLARWQDAFQNSGKGGKLVLVFGTAVSLFLLICCLCSIPVMLVDTDNTPEAADTSIASDSMVDEDQKELSRSDVEVPIAEEEQGEMPSATWTPEPTIMPSPTSTATATIKPTKTPTATSVPPTEPPPTKTPTATHVPPTSPPPTATQPPATATVPPTLPPPTATQPPATATVPPTLPPPTATPLPAVAEPPTAAAPTEPPPPPAPVAPGPVVITSVNKQAEYVDIQNQGTVDVDLGGWMLRSERGSQDCYLGSMLGAGQACKNLGNE